MSTKVYGSSDDLIEFEGDLSGEVGRYGTNELELGLLLAFSDGTVLAVKYGKPVGGVWQITVLREGGLFDRFEACHDPDSKMYSDIVHFKDGTLKAWWADRAETVS